MTNQYNTAVLGGGPGGYVAAIRSAKLGYKTVLIEKSDIGGTCLNRGCIPTKALLHSAEVYQTVREAKEYGVSAENVKFDYKKIAAKKDSVVKSLRGGVQYLLKNAGVTVINGEGVLADRNTIVVDGKDEIQSDNIVVATGSRPAKVPIPGIDGENVLNSDDVLKLVKAPESIVIIGGGVIGIEFATLFNELDKEVTVVEMLPQILTGVDDEISSLMRKELAKKGIKIHTSAKVTEIKSSDGVTCCYQADGKDFEIKAEVCVVAIGRKPNTEKIGLEKVGIKTTRGFIDIDDSMKTNIDNIYAIGDVSGKVQLAHVASTQGLIAAANIAGQDKKLKYDTIPSCIYTSPEIACVGMDEQGAREKGRNIKVGRFPVSANGKSMIMGEKSGLAKLITDADTGEILGAQIMAPRATDIIAEICVAMKAEATIEELEDTIHPHPTVSEMIMEAAHDVEKLCVHAP